MRWPDSWKGPYWEPRDLWIGAYWTREVSEVAKWEAWEALYLYICLIPCFPIRLMWVGRVASRAERMERREVEQNNNVPSIQGGESEDS